MGSCTKKIIYACLKGEKVFQIKKGYKILAKFKF